MVNARLRLEVIKFLDVQSLEEYLFLEGIGIAGRVILEWGMTA